jgi:4-amino-4-deoxy-L-arabinose transferase-like glycosyltransferase
MDSHGVNRPSRWLALGLLLGLAGLSKYTAIFAAVAVVVCLWWAHGWRLLRSPWPWVALVVALLVVSPVAVWNAQNQWISFTYQAKHGAGSIWRFSSLLQFLVVQLIVFGPLLCWGWTRYARHMPSVPHVARMFFVLPFVVLAAMSGGGSSLPHWTAPAWVALAPFAGMALAHGFATGQRGWITALTGLQVLISVVLLALMLSGGAPFIGARPGARADQPNPFADLYGWDQAGQRARALAQQNQLASVSVQNWTLASRLGWSARPLPVHVLEDRFDQFDLWAGDLAKGGDTLLVDWSQMAYEVPVGVHGFQQCSLLDTLPVQRWGQHLSSFRFYLCRGWSADPLPLLINPD